MEPSDSQNVGAAELLLTIRANHGLRAQVYGRMLQELAPLCARFDVVPEMQGGPHQCRTGFLVCVRQGVGSIEAHSALVRLRPALIADGEELEHFGVWIKMHSARPMYCTFENQMSVMCEALARVIGEAPGAYADGLRTFILELSPRPL